MITVSSEVVGGLIEALQGGRIDLTTFERQILELGTPIIEEREGYSRFVWVTHVFDAQRPVSNVVLYEEGVAYNPERAVMDPIEGTNFFWKTTIVPYNHQLHYGFIVDHDPTAPFDQSRLDLSLSLVSTPVK